jgi:hypothetical protein
LHKTRVIKHMLYSFGAHSNIESVVVFQMLVQLPNIAYAKSRLIRTAYCCASCSFRLISFIPAQAKRDIPSQRRTDGESSSSATYVN